MSKSSNYWRKREREWKKADLKDEAEYIQEIQDIYSTMLTQINKEIESFFVRYSNKEGMSMAEAKRKASDIDIKEYEKKAKKYVKEKDFSKEANEQMRFYNLAMKVNRLELLKANIGLELTAGSDELVSFTKEKLEGAALEQIQRNAGILGDTIVDNAKTAKTIANSSFKNATFSERIWSQQDLLKNDLYGILSTALIQGRNPREFIPKVRKSFDVTRYQAERLLRTELTRVRIQAQVESYEANGIDEYEYVACGLRDVCPICKVLDKQIFKLKDMEPGENAPPMHPNCVLPDTEIIAPGIEAITKSDYSGDVIKFVTANGRNVTVTPNHIVPTSRGWIRAKNLIKGDKVFCYRGCIESRTIGTPTDNNRTLTIENLFASIIEAQSSTTCCVPAASIDLKGDVIPNSKINIIFVDGKLGDKINTLMSKFISDSFLIGTGETRESVLSRDGSLSKLLIRIGLAFDGFMGRFDKGSVFFRSSATSRDLISLRRASDYDARLFKYSVNNTATDFILIGNSQTTHAGSVISDNGSLINLSLSSVNRNSQSNSIFNENFFNSFSSLMDNSRYLSDTFTTLIEVDDIIDIQRCFYSGHVYDASSLSTLYIANGIVTSNCHCSTAPHSDRKIYENWLDGLANGEHSLRFDEWKEKQALHENKKGPITVITESAINRVPFMKLTRLTEKEAKKLQAIHKRLLEESRVHNQSNEVGYKMTPDFKPKETKYGSDDKLIFSSVSISPKTYVAHNHPRNNSYSINDLLFFYENEDVRLLTIVKNNGNIELLDKANFDKGKFKILVRRNIKKYTSNKGEIDYDKVISQTLKEASKKGLIEWMKS